MILNFSGTCRTEWCMLVPILAPVMLVIGLWVTNGSLLVLPGTLIAGFIALLFL